ncbi:MAG: 4-phosphoerythronate dehydrogenase, partial [Bacteroidetes bacterium]|nr:4-phosphoerythronate dehydrogenase [Bacteroidota bacterium]
MKIVADHKIAFLQGVLEPFVEVVYLSGSQIRQKDLRDADALLTRSVTSCNEELLHETKVRFIASATIGDDHIDKDFCRSNQIQWATAKGCNANAVVQYFTSALLSIAELSGIDLKDKVIGIIGAGNIGTKVEKVCRALGMKVLLNDPPRERAEGSKGFSGLKDILEIADIITLHVPLTYSGEDKTFHLADQTFFNGLQKPVLLLNSSRGAVIDSEALKIAIKEGKISHTVLDVWEGEPGIDTELLELVSVGTPHIAGYSLEGKARATEMIVNSMGKFFNLPVIGWKPDLNITREILQKDCSGLRDQQAIASVVRQAYDVLRDDRVFRENPAAFEQIRGNYSFRKENGNFAIRLI